MKMEFKQMKIFVSKYIYNNDNITYLLVLRTCAEPQSPAAIDFYFFLS